VVAAALSAPFAARDGRTSVFITERVVFRTVDGALELIEIAPGIDLEKDVLQQMGFRPRIASDLKRMDKRLFMPAVMNLRADIEAKAQPAGRSQAILRRAV
jgi:propionate CoA-transferase